MALEIVGAGFGRTGTLSLKSALEKLGFDRCYHMIEVKPDHRAGWLAAQRGEPVDWEALLDGFKAAVDWPACNSWRTLSEYYPRSKVVLSVRDPERWYDSVRNTIYPASMSRLDSKDAAARSQGEFVKEIIWDGVFRGRLEDKDYAIGIYNAHTAEVKAAIPASRLLVFEPSDGWGPLCEFVRRDIPDEPYPLVNTTEEFRSRFRA